MSERDEWDKFEDDELLDLEGLDAEDAIALEALVQFHARDGDDELDDAFRDAFAAVAQEALALKEDRLAREASRARAEEQQRLENERRQARAEVARRNRLRREAGEDRLVEERARAQRARERLEAEERRLRVARQRAGLDRLAREQREREAQLPAERQRRARQSPRLDPANPNPAGRRPPKDWGPVRAQREHSMRGLEPRRPRAAAGTMEPRGATSSSQSIPTTSNSTRPTPRARAVTTERPSPPADAGVSQHKEALTGADLASWRERLGLNQKAAAQRLGVAQGTISKAESKRTKLLGPSLREALAAVL